MLAVSYERGTPVGVRGVCESYVEKLELANHTGVLCEASPDPDTTGQGCQYNVFKAQRLLNHSTLGLRVIRNSFLLGPCRRPMPRALWWSQVGGAFSYERGTPVGFRGVCESYVEKLELANHTGILCEANSKP